MCSEQAWSLERTSYLGTVLQKMMRGYTEAAVSFTTGLLTFISRFALQASLQHCGVSLAVKQRPRAPQLGAQTGALVYLNSSWVHEVLYPRRK